MEIPFPGQHVSEFALRRVTPGDVQRAVDALARSAQRRRACDDDQRLAPGSVGDHPLRQAGQLSVGTLHVLCDRAPRCHGGGERPDLSAQRGSRWRRACIGRPIPPGAGVAAPTPGNRQFASRSQPVRRATAWRESRWLRASSTNSANRGARAPGTAGATASATPIPVARHARATRGRRQPSSTGSGSECV